MENNQLSGTVIDAAFAVHSALGPGILESAYRLCLVKEMAARCLDVQTELAIPICYRGERIETGFPLDLLVERQLIVELKAVTQIAPIYKAQLLSYLKLSNLRVGLLINFHVGNLRKGLFGWLTEGSLNHRKEEF